MSFQVLALGAEDRKTSMTTEIRYPIRHRVNECFNRYRDAMRPFIMNGLRAMPGSTPEEYIGRALKEHQSQNFQKALEAGETVEDAFDETHFPSIVGKYWHETMSNRIQDPEANRHFRSWLWSLRSYRNQGIGHPSSRDLDPERATEYMDVMSDVLTAIQASSANADVLAFREGLKGLEGSRTNDASPSDGNQQTGPATDGQSVPSSRHRPWREVIKPHDDVIYGNLRQAEFAADLQKVYDGDAEDDMYGNPLLFFRQTYMTKGITDLLTNTLKRLAGNDGYPVIQAKTGFGGGKTHSLIALYHLVTSGSTIANANWDERDRESRECIRHIMRNAGVSIDQGVEARISVLNGTYLSPTDTTPTVNGDPLNTLWGVMAYQLGGQAAYDIIGDAARGATAPGGRELRRLFEAVGPCVILMDEIVNYARNVNDYRRLESIYSFFQNLTETVKNIENVAVVISLPESEVELGSAEGAVEILRHLETILGRVETVWRPVEDQEGFEVVRRQLFRDETCDEGARNETCEYFFSTYTRKNLRSKFPGEASQPEYLERMKQCYPIHPEIFDRLYNDWSTLHQFQRTRGVLRLMATCVHLLYNAQDDDLLITPGSLPINETELGNEFLRLLPPNWNPVLDEVDKNGSRTDEIDRGNSRFRDHKIAKRMARSIFLGSPPHQHNPGLRDQNATLGAFVPGTPIGDYSSALKNMGERLYHLYREQGRHRFNSDVNLTRVINDRKSQLTAEEREDELIRRIRDLCDHPIVLACPEDSSEVPDSEELQVVVLKPGDTYHQSPSNNRAAEVARAMISTFGYEPRLNRNSLLFLAANTDQHRRLDESIRNLLAWQSTLYGEKRFDQLSEPRLHEAREGIETAEQDLDQALRRSYTRVAIPNSGTNVVKWKSLSRGAYTLDERTDEVLQDADCITQLNADHIRTVFERCQNDLGPDQFVSVADVWRMMTTNVNLLRPPGWAAVEDAVRAGLADSRFGYGHTYYEERDDFQSLSMGGRILESGYVTDGEPDSIAIDGILLSSDVASLYLSVGQVLSDDGNAGPIESETLATDGQSGTADPLATPGSGQIEGNVASGDLDQEIVAINDEHIGSIAPASESVAEVLGQESGDGLQTIADEQVTAEQETPGSVMEIVEPGALTKSAIPGETDVDSPKMISIDFRPQVQTDHVIASALGNQWANLLANEGNQVQKHINLVYQMSTTLQEIPNHWEVKDLVTRLINEASPGRNSDEGSSPDISFSVIIINPDGISSRIVDDIRSVVASTDFITMTETT